ncbi:MAG TPA: hypothetical protein EYH17_04835 [Pyrodictium sp.]|nr:hypothetical protein [Pyrodictium sp.]
MILRLFRRRSSSAEDDRKDKLLERTSRDNNGENLANPTTTPNTARNPASKTVVLAELVKILANPSQLLKLIRNSPILYVGYVRNDKELKSIIEKYGNTLLLLSVRSDSKLIHVIYFDGKFYTLIDGTVKVVNKLISDNENARIIVYKID